MTANRRRSVAVNGRTSRPGSLFITSSQRPALMTLDATSAGAPLGEGGSLNAPDRRQAGQQGEGERVGPHLPLGFGAHVREVQAVRRCFHGLRRGPALGAVIAQSVGGKSVGRGNDGSAGCVWHGMVG